jgi:transposase-like protein/DNA-directed RNA polymerase subunit RPC12/RpoP
MTILRFMEEFPTEDSCKAHFKIQREQEGVECKKCGETHHYWLKAKDQWQCRTCNFRTTLKSGSIMQGSKVDFHTWYKAMAFMTYSKKTISAAELQRQLNHPKYDTIWRLMHKIRSAMGKRDALYQLEGAIEFDEGYFEKATSEKVKLKRGRGSQRQMNVAVMAESTPLEDIETGIQSRQCRYFKMQVLYDHKAETINDTIEDKFVDKSIVFSDKSTSYVDISDYVEIHMTEKSDKQVTKSTLKWVHIAISNAKRTLLGVFHKIKGKYLQLYLNEFCYKLNRRYFRDRVFDRLTLAVAKSYW